MTNPERPSFGPDARSEWYKARQELIAETGAKLFVRELPPEYQELISGKSHFIELGAPYSENLSYRAGHEKGLTEWMNNKLAGETILDLGCGDTGNTERLSVNEWGAKQYIGVDLHRYYDIPVGFVTEDDDENEDYLDISLSEHSNVISDRPYEEPVPQTESRVVEIHDNAVYVLGDMLDCISRLEDNSMGAVSMSGIEIMGKDWNDYMEALKNEITRVLKPGGIIIDYESDISIGKDQFTKVFPIGDQHNGIYQKIASQ